ncbi:hypothetical protein UCDDS831_g03449 [Diplodia seriata]|uniref:Uncharacterized protein n=1 Tax=Diplodia seriata TaxID=420778 RepID=A0A0G2EK47_9PEZI|nr:hypothetical protein UCDDS831_g03449 [Diplodia seriata]
MFGLGLNLGGGSSSSGGGGGGGGGGPGFGCGSTSNNSLTFSTRSTGIHFLGGDDSCTSLTDLILAENENIFGRRELEMANPEQTPPESGHARVWEDGEEQGFWESPSAKQQREMVERAGKDREMSSCSSLSVYATPCGGEEEMDLATTGGSAVVVGRASSEFFDSDAENRTPTGKNGAAGGVTVGKEEGKRRRWTGRGGGGNSDRQREVLAPKVLISVQPPSEQSTPRSLYDRDGFLK